MMATPPEPLGRMVRPLWIRIRHPESGILRRKLVRPAWQLLPGKIGGAGPMPAQEFRFRPQIDQRRVATRNFRHAAIIRYHG